MPANRSRTQEWRRCLKQVFERNGALEVAVAHQSSENANPHLVWRVRLLGITERELLIEQPSTLGQVIRIDSGIQLIVAMCIGQNRWMFKTTNLGPSKLNLADHKSLPALRLAMPETVERCQRRNHYRVETAQLNLPQVEIWPLLDPKSVLVAERACVLHAETHAKNSGKTNPSGVWESDLAIPEVGPKFTGTLVNLGGGGVGLRIRSQDAQALAHHKLFWVRIALTPAIATPVCATGKLVHTHMESNHDTYAGLAFDFSFNPAHQRFVVDQICRYLANLQGSNVRTGESELRKAG